MVLPWLKRRTYGTVGYVSRTTGSAILKLGQELSLGKKYSSSRPAAVLTDTVRPTVAGAGKHRGWDAARAIAQRITTPLLPDDYLKLANPLWSARELRGAVRAEEIGKNDGDRAMRGDAAQKFERRIQIRPAALRVVK